MRPDRATPPSEGEFVAGVPHIPEALRRKTPRPRLSLFGPPRTPHHVSSYDKILCRIFPRGGGVRTPCKTHRKTHCKIPRCFNPVFASDDPSRVPIVSPAARVGSFYTDNPSRGARNFTRGSCRLPVHGRPVKGARNFTRRSCRLCLLNKEVKEHDAPRNFFNAFLCPTCLPLCPNPCNPTLPTFKSEENEFSCSDRHAPFVKLNVISTRAGCSAH